MMRHLLWSVPVVALAWLAVISAGVDDAWPVFGVIGCVYAASLVGLAEGLRRCG